MHIPLVAAWSLTALFAAFAVPSLYRLARAAPSPAGRTGRADEGLAVRPVPGRRQASAVTHAVSEQRGKPAVGGFVSGQPAESARSRSVAEQRQADLAELLTAIAMVAMVSPLGGPIPAAGWQAVLVLVAGWFAVAAVRGRGRARRNCAVHHAICAAAMLYMFAAMPRHSANHGPWLTMSEMPGRLGWPALALLAAGYFAFDTVRVGYSVLRDARESTVREVLLTRATCRTVLGAGMAYMLVVGLTRG